MEVDPNGAPQAPAAPPAPASTSSNKRNQRGAGSKSKHDASFRQKAGAKTMAANDARIDQRLFAHLTSISTKLRSFDTELQPIVSTIPQTTRGLGFAVQQTFVHMDEHQFRTNLRLPILYRCTLATHWYIRSKSGHNGNFYRPMAPERSAVTEPFLGFNQVVENNTTTFNACVAALSCFGDHESSGRVYHGFHPNSGLYYPTSSPSGSAPARKRARKAGPTTSPDEEEEAQNETPSNLNPYTVCFDNLRSVVTELSSPRTPVEARQYFIERNPLPGAVFDNNLLMNPDEIMPRVYSQCQLANDYRVLKATIDIGAGRFNSWFSEANLTGKANAGMFVSIDAPNMCIVDGIVTGTESVKSVSSEKIASNHYLLGFLSMVGEQCAEQRQHSLVYGPRRMQTGVVRQNLAWDQIVQSLY